MNIDSFVSTVQHRITGGSEYQWQCYGTQARWLDAGWAQDGDKWQASAVFDPITQRVYECHVSDYRQDRAWCWRDPEFAEAHDREAQQRDVDPRVAWDAVLWQSVSTEQEILQRIRVVSDNRESIEIDLPNDEMLEICLQAHELDMTLNQYIEMVLRRYIEDNHPGVLEADQELKASMSPKKSKSKKSK